MTDSAAKAPRRPPRIVGLFHDDSRPDSYWIRDRGHLRLPGLAGVGKIAVVGEVMPPGDDPTAAGDIGCEVALDGTVRVGAATLPVGPFRFELPVPPADDTVGHRLEFTLGGVGFSNLLAWLGRVTGVASLQPWRRQARNRRVRIARVEADGEVLFDFANRSSPWNHAFARRHLKLGFNVVGFFRADLGVGESARCMARAADAAQLPVALVDLKLPCKNPLSDGSFAARLQRDNPHPVSVFHLDPPAARDIDHHHGAGFRRGRYNVGYWAWELPEFPDAWTHFAEYFDEIWAPSRFAAESIGAKVSVPVLTMPHAVAFPRPTGDLRAKFGLPADQFLFLFLYDLNSYSERKNPAAALAAFRASGLAGRGAALVIKVHNVAGNPQDFSRLQADCADLPGTVLLTETLSRAAVYELEAACDCFISLHRSEGFGLAIAECMYLGKPVIATDWSGSAEFLDTTNGCPVPCSLVTLDRSHGPYAKGQTWADADIGNAAEWMRRLQGDRALGARLGAAARATIEARFAPEVVGARYRRRLEAIAGW